MDFYAAALADRLEDFYDAPESLLPPLCDRVTRVLAQTGLLARQTQFRNEELNWESLILLTPSEFDEMGIPSEFHRPLLLSINKERYQNATPWYLAALDPIVMRVLRQSVLVHLQYRFRYEEIHSTDVMNLTDSDLEELNLSNAEMSLFRYYAGEVLPR